MKLPSQGYSKALEVDIDVVDPKGQRFEVKARPFCFSGPVWGGGGWQSSGLGFRIEDSGCSGLQLAFENHKIGMCFSGFLDPQKPPQNINASKPKALEPKLRPKPHAFSSRRPVTAHIMAFSSETRNHTLKQEPPI